MASYYDSTKNYWSDVDATVRKSDGKVLTFTRTSKTGTANRYHVVERVSVSSPYADGKIQMQSNPHNNTQIHLWQRSGYVEYDYLPYSTYPTIFRYGRGREPSGEWITINFEGGPSVPYASPARVKAYNRLFSGLGDFSINLAVAYAERQDTVNLVAKTFRRLVHAVKSLKKGRYKEVASAFGIDAKSINVIKLDTLDLASKWLALQYGWLPLLSDIRKALEFTLPKPVTFTYKFTGVDNIRNKPFTSVNGHFGNFSADDRVTVDGLCTVVDPTIVTMNQLGLLNPMTVLWEKLPWSFVVDWALPIGKWLEQQTALLGLRLSNQGETVTRKAWWQVKSKPYSLAGTGYTITQDIPWAYGGFSKKKNRTVGLNPVPILPQFKNPLSTTHALNALALMRTNFR